MRYLVVLIVPMLLAACRPAAEAPPVEPDATEGPPAVGAHVAAEEGERLRFPDGREAVLKVTREGQGAQHLLLGTESLPPGTAIPVHSHDGYEEILFVHRGTPLLTLGDSTVRARPGATLYVPPGTWHGVAGSEADSATVLFIFPEVEIADFFRAVGQAEGESPPQLDSASWSQIMERHRMRSPVE